MNEIDDLKTRLASVERSNRINRFLLAGLAVLFLGLSTFFAVTNFRIPNVLRAHSVDVVSKDGKTVVRLRDDSWTKGGAVTVMDDSGERRGWFRAGPYGGHLMITGAGPEGQSMAGALDVWRRHADLILANTKKEYQATLEMDDNSAAVRLHDKRGDLSTAPGKRK